MNYKSYCLRKVVTELSVCYMANISHIYRIQDLYINCTTKLIGNFLPQLHDKIVNYNIYIITEYNLNLNT